MLSYQKSSFSINIMHAYLKKKVIGMFVLYYLEQHDLLYRLQRLQMLSPVKDLRMVVKP